MAQTSLNSTGVASSGALSLQSNGTTEAIGISTGQVATLAQNPILTSGTANGVAYLNGSKAVTSGSALVFDGANLGLGVTPSAWSSGYRVMDFKTSGASIASSGESVQLGTNVYDNSGWKFAYTSSYKSSRYQQFDGAHSWYSSTAGGTAGNAVSFTQAMTLDASGNLLVGTTSGSSSARAVIRREDVTSTTKAANTIVKVGPATGTSRDANIVCSDFAAYDYYFGGRGGVAYVTVNNNQGVQLSAGATSWSSDSDETLKDIIEPITGAIQKVSSWRSVIGKYKTDEEGTRRVFFMAQDFETSLPEAVEQSPEGTLLLRYQDAIPVLAAAIQEQQALITSLTARITALEAE